MSEQTTETIETIPIPVIRPSESVFSEYDPPPSPIQLARAVFGVTRDLVQEGPFSLLENFATLDGGPSGWEEKLEQERKKLEYEAYGNEEVLDLFRGSKSKEDPSNPEKQKRKLAILALSGGQAGSNGAAILLGMEDVGALARLTQ